MVWNIDNKDVYMNACEREFDSYIHVSIQATALLLESIGMRTDCAECLLCYEQRERRMCAIDYLCEAIIEVYVIERWQFIKELLKVAEAEGISELRLEVLRLWLERDVSRIERWLVRVDRELTIRAQIEIEFERMQAELQQLLQASADAA